MKHTSKPSVGSRKFADRKHTKKPSVGSRKLPDRKRIHDEWETQRSEIEQLYLTEKRHLNDVMKIMAQHGVNQYKKRFTKWGIRKNRGSKSLEVELDNDVSSPPTSEPLDPLAPEAITSNSDDDNMDLVTKPRRQPQRWEDRQCLRCLMLGLETKFSGEDFRICDACKKLVRTRQKETLWFFACVKTDIRDVNIFKAYLPADVQPARIQAAANRLALSRITLDFASQISDWHLDNYVNDLVGWIKGLDSSVTSKAGYLSSNEFLGCVTTALDKRICTNFQLMMYAISLAYTQCLSSVAPNISDVLHVGSFAGYNLLEALGEKLEVSALQRYSRNELQALFLLLTGTILAINYCPEQSNVESQRPFLCSILAHYMVCVAWRLNLPFNPGPRGVEGLDQDILLGAPHQWHREGSFEWSSMDLEVVPTISSSRSGDKTAIEIESRSMTEELSATRQDIFDRMANSAHLCRPSAFRHCKPVESKVVRAYRCTFRAYHGKFRAYCLAEKDHLRHSLGLRRHVETHHNTASAGSMKPLTPDPWDLNTMITNYEPRYDQFLEPEPPYNELSLYDTSCLSSLPNPNSNTQSCGVCGIAAEDGLCNCILIGVSNPLNTMQKWKGKLLV